MPERAGGCIIIKQHGTTTVAQPDSTYPVTRLLTLSSPCGNIHTRVYIRTHIAPAPASVSDKGQREIQFQAPSPGQVRGMECRS